ncbi:Uncharacterised protein [Corynebacterium matruchotii]|uniref:Uncharacterized protein n=1 Tax=Corynebacterium matruchotii TaxID=43768 RepID=A0A8B4H9L5_9CORY|nr:Uncharacterised protein [Corynebacterium matruchotii]
MRCLVAQALVMRSRSWAPRVFQSLMGVNIGVGVRWVPAPLAAILVQPERENVASWSPCPILPASPRMVASSGVKEISGSS